jgi:hypothetical protein
MSAVYTPRDGTLAQRLIAHLTRAGGGASMSASEIKAHFDVANVGNNLATAVKHGLLTTEGKGRAVRYSLAQEPAPADGKLAYALHSDGDVSVHGGVPCEDGSVMYTRAQLEQLIDAVTKPHIPPRTVAVETVH